MSKIPCLVVAYFDFESVKATVDSVLAHAGTLDLMVLENPSEFTESCIRPYVQDLVRSRVVSQYFLFEENISNNAVETVLNSGYIDLTRSEYVLLTDGDLLIQDDGWLDEQVEILDRHPEVFACAVSLDLINLPVQTFPEAHNWLPSPRSETELYTEVATGMHMLLVRSAGLRRFLRHARRRDLRFRDSVLCDYSYRVLRQKWVSTKRSTARHLAWDRYSDRDHPYTKLKLARSFQEIWNHDSYCGFERHTLGGIQRCSAGRVAGRAAVPDIRELWNRVRRHRGAICGR